ncbi:MAG: CorA family divalent cation transporter [Eubacterium sp.]
MIKVFNAKEKNEFADLADTPEVKEVRDSRDYAVNVGKKAYLITFHYINRRRVTIYADPQQCCVMTDSLHLRKIAGEIDAPSGIREANIFFQRISKNDMFDLQSLEKEVQALEDKLFAEKTPNRHGIDEIRKLRREILRRKRYYELMEFITDELTEMDSDFSYISKKFDRLYKVILRTQEFAEEVRDAYQSQVDIQQNNIMKFLTIITTMFMPLQLITGWYGMNLKMPEVHWRFGYPYVIALSIAISLIMYWICKRKKWF